MKKPSALLVAASALLALPASASANFPGTNGDLVVSTNTTVSTLSSDGTRSAPVVPANGTYGAPSPDATQIAYSTLPEPANHITIANTDGTEATPITNAPSNARDHSPAWSPDGSKIAFSRVVSGKGTIWVVNADGTGLKQLSTGGAGILDQDDPSWSPDGTRIAYVVIGDGSVNGVWWMNADGTSQTREAPTAAGDNVLSVDWSPDGTQLAYTNSSGGNGNGGIYVKQVGDIAAATRIRAVDFADTISWSPDGTRLAYASEDEANNSFEWDVYTVAADGLGVATRLTGPSPNDAQTDDFRNGVSWATVAPPAPAATTNAASGLSTASATLNGTVNPHGGATACRFEYGTSASYGSSVPCSTASLSGSSDQAVSAALSSLPASTTYHYRVVAKKGGQTARGADQTLTTSAPAAEQPAATPVTAQPTKAILPLPDITTPAEAKAAAVAALGDLTRDLAKAGTAQLAKGVLANVVVKEPGTYVMGVYAAATTAKSSAGKRKLVLLASGRKAFTAAGKGKVRIKATAKGRSVLKRAKKLKVVIRTTFTPVGGKPVVSERTTTLKKKKK